MLSNTLVGIRPPAPPTHQTPEELHDRFHMSVASAKPLSLPAVTADCFSEAQRQVQELEKTRGLQVSKAEDVVVIPLGTGSALPTKYRNGPSFLASEATHADHEIKFHPRSFRSPNRGISSLMPVRGHGANSVGSLASMNRHRQTYGRFCEI